MTSQVISPEASARACWPRRTRPRRGHRRVGGSTPSHARRAAERLEANKLQGSAGEVRVEGEILSGNPIAELGSPATLVGSQVQVETSAGLRIIDHLVELPTGELVALEVKTGGAVRSQYRLDCDLALELQGGRRAGGGPIGPIRTVVLQR